MTGYTKLFGSLIHSTVWQKEPHVKLVWITMLALVDKDGIVEASVPGLAKASGVTIEQTEDALSSFLSPDPYSRTKEAEGRRIETIDGGWHLINHRKYREMMASDERRERNAERMRTVRTVRARAQACEKVQEVSHTEAEAAPDPEADTKPEAEAAALPRESDGFDLEVLELARAIRSEPALAHCCDPLVIAERALPVGKRRPVAWLLQAVSDAASKTPPGEQAHMTLNRLWGFLKHAKAPRVEDKPPKPPAHVDDTDPAAVARIRRGPKRVTAQTSGLVPGSPEAIEAFVNSFGRSSPAAQEPRQPLSESELADKARRDRERLAEADRKAGAG